MTAKELFRRVEDEALLRLSLRGPRGHALREDGLRALAEALDEESRGTARPLLVEAEGQSFCTGLDLDSAARLDRRGVRALMRAFHDCLRTLLLYPGGSVAAVGGHALAGGAILALACDARVVAEGAGRLGIHGIRLGIAYPDVAVEVVRRRFPRRHAEQILYAGETLAAEEAALLGWADAVVPRDELSAAARAQLSKMGAGGVVFASNKARALDLVSRRLAEMDSDGEERFLDVWFSGETQRRLSQRTQ